MNPIFLSLEGTCVVQPRHCLFSSSTISEKKGSIIYLFDGENATQ